MTRARVLVMTLLVIGTSATSCSSEPLAEGVMFDGTYEVTIPNPSINGQVPQDGEAKIGRWEARARCETPVEGCIVDVSYVPTEDLPEAADSVYFVRLDGQWQRSTDTGLGFTCNNPNLPVPPSWYRAVLTEAPDGSPNFTAATSSLIGGGCPTLRTNQLTLTRVGDAPEAEANTANEPSWLGENPAGNPAMAFDGRYEVLQRAVDGSFNDSKTRPDQKLTVTATPFCAGLTGTCAAAVLKDNSAVVWAFEYSGGTWISEYDVDPQPCPDKPADQTYTIHVSLSLTASAGAGSPATSLGGTALSTYSGACYIGTFTEAAMSFTLIS